MIDRPATLHVLVLAGGPDREREVSLVSGAAVAGALREAGHDVTESDVGPGNLAAIDGFAASRADVIFPVLHGPWGEGGGLQHLLDERQLPYVGCSHPVAALCMDKHRTKLALENEGLPTPAFQLLVPGEAIAIDPPLVLKPLAEGSSIDVRICRSRAEADAARAEMIERHGRLLVEGYVEGTELTVGVIGRGGDRGPRSLPPIRIEVATDFYDYAAKYERDDTRYRFDTGLGAGQLEAVETLALDVYRGLGCRHLARVDLFVDAGGAPWVIEVNTMPGFTPHSLLPKAAAEAGWDLPALVNHLVRLPLA